MQKVTIKLSLEEGKIYKTIPDCGYFYTYKEGMLLCRVHKNDEWVETSLLATKLLRLKLEEVKQPITFIEAVNSGKAFYSEYDQHSVFKIENDLLLYKGHICSINKTWINGKWYLKD